MSAIVDAARTVLARPGYRLLAVASFAGFAALYLMSLPAAYTGGRIGPIALSYLTPELVAIALVMAAMLGLTVAFMAFAWRRQQGISAGSAAGGAVVGLVTPLLCCSPLLPSLLGVVAALFPALAGTAAGSLQGFIATHETAILLAGLALVAWALYRNARRAAAGAFCAAPSPAARQQKGIGA